MWLTAVLLAVVAFLSFAWSSLLYFRLAFQRDVRKRRLVGTSLICMAIVWYTIAGCPPRTPAWLLGGSTLLLLSLTVFWGAIFAHGHDRPTNAFIRTAPRALICGGPYRFIRHPFYTSYLTFYLAIFFLADNWLVLFTVPWVGIFYYAAAREEEASFLNSEFAEEYGHYMARTGMFLPKLWRRTVSAGCSLPSTSASR